jgi:hypothetical protein
MSESVEQILLALLKSQSAQATVERRELRESFEKNLQSIRNEFRVFGLLIILGLFALLGVGANVHVPGMTIQTSTVPAPTMTVSTTDPERADDATPPAEDPHSDAEHAPLEP